MGARRAFYVTTPLYYVNARPHIGHAYTTIAADCLARYHRLLGEDVLFLTGTDEHGEKIAQAAKASGMELREQEFVNGSSQVFRSLWEAWGVSNDDFIRTTEERHTRPVREALRQLVSLERFEHRLQKGLHTCWYCVPCETRWGISDVASSNAEEKRCPTCQRVVQLDEEEGYYLPLEPHREWLLRHIEQHDDFIRPRERRNEVLELLRGRLPDLCVTRPKARVPWGIPVAFPKDEQQYVAYVWFDALLNYISALGWEPEHPDARFHRYWEGAGAVHLIGKDILRHHALYWPIILRVLGLPPPRTIFAHGWWLMKDEKMSKSKGNIVDPGAVAATYGVDAFRYFLLREVAFGVDGQYSQEALEVRINSDLANDLGNLVWRTLTMVEKYYAGRIPRPEQSFPMADPVREAAERLPERMQARMGMFDLQGALAVIWDVVGAANKLVEVAQPWHLAREQRQGELATFCATLLEALRVVSVAVGPFLPDTAGKIRRQLGLEPELLEGAFPQLRWDAQTLAGRQTAKGTPLFPRIER